MRKLITLAVALMITSICFAQKDVTKFLGIPVDGTKSAMIQKLKAKGFTYNQRLDCLEGEFNGSEVKVHVVTNNNKVYRIVIEDAYSVDEAAIKVRFNTLCRQFKNNGKYVSLSENQMIGKDDDISYEMTVHNKRYEASFSQNSKESIEELDTTFLVEYLHKKALELYTAEELSKMTEEQESELKKTIAMQYTLELLDKKTVWFIIDEYYGSYRILIFYDNGYNQANGEDL